MRKWEEDLASVPIPKVPRQDLSYSYDGVLVASPRFRQVVEERKIDGAVFRPLQAGLFWLRPSIVVEFDAQARGTVFETRCERCGSYESVVGATPVFLTPGSRMSPNAIARTDLEFGSDDEKTPLILCATSRC
jgi:hypothetical protein